MMGGALASMTGYARADGGADGTTWVWELRSVNGRALEVRSRLGTGFDHLEPVVRERAAAALARGNVAVSLRVNRTAANREVAINRVLLGQLVDAARELSGDGPAPAGPPLSPDALFGVPGVVEISEAAPSERERERLDTALLADFDRALAGLAAARAAEGARLGVILTEHLDAITALTGRAGESAASQPAAIRDRLAERIAELVGDASIAPERLAQEAAILALKADVREELDRLAVHADAARELLKEGGAVGRRLDFLAQEFSREANTLCAKSASAELTQAGLGLKAAINHLREQVQNLE